jgi:hypothetical protein
MRRRSARILFAAVCALALPGSLALGATAPIYDFNGGHGAFTSQIRERGTKYSVTSVTLLCGSTSYVSATPNVTLSRSGKFSYSGSGKLFSGAKNKQSKATLKISGTINVAKLTGTAKASSTVKGCKSFSGKVTGYLVPVGT